MDLYEPYQIMASKFAAFYHFVLENGGQNTLHTFLLQTEVCSFHKEDVETNI